MRIVGGTAARQNSWPWQILLTDKKSLCGGILIAPQWMRNYYKINLKTSSIRFKIKKKKFIF
jgi:secreted trypsin-like serine protease